MNLTVQLTKSERAVITLCRMLLSNNSANRGDSHETYHRSTALPVPRTTSSTAHADVDADAEANADTGNTVALTKVPATNDRQLV